ncbi:MAG: SDR family NAD(P)-dependent oxidoreductase, partial [Catenulispora sp.]|nr:SDR family NAD(P)-dependent oxidoreductase [Catenulispora sp.]
PVIWSGVELYGAAGRDLRVRVEFESTDSGLAPAGVLLTDVNGSPVARIGRLKFEHGRGAQPYAEHLYEVGFEPAQLVADAPSLEDTIVVGDAALGETLGVETAADLDALAKRFDTGTDVPRRLLFAMRDDDPERSAANALRSLQLCLDDARLQDTELVWVTRDAVSSNPDDEVRNWADAAVWGLIRVARTEQAERVLRLIDVDSGTLLARALGTPNEAECVVRGTTALVPRMRPASAESGEYLPRALDPDGTVLITGGLGELGGALAAHLVRGHGVRRVVLVSRRGGASTTTDSLLRELEVAGAERVDVVAADVADRSAVAAILAGIDPKHPLTAVFHLAGVLDDGLVPGFTEDRLRRVMAPKVRGARHLDELTQHLELAAFVLFSSAAGTLGTAGQGAYAAANATLDALAANRRRRGLPGLSLAFGLWEQAGVGMTAHLGKAELGRLRRQGIGALTLEEGLRALDAALARSEPYLVPVRLELASLRHALGDDEAPPLLRAMLRAGRRTVGGPGDAGGPDSAVRPDGAEAPAALQPGQSGQLGYPGQPGRSPRSLEDQIANASEADRPALLLHLVRSEAAAVLGLPGPDSVPGDKPLRSLGIDSLTMIELRKRLAKRTDTALPATLVFDYPTADAIAGLLARETGA